MKRISILLITVTLLAGMVGCGDGYTPPSQNFEIWDWYDLDAVRDYLGRSYLLMNNLDSTTAGYEELASPTANGGKGWQPIGNVDNQFTGTFNGRGYEIRDLFINRSDEYDVGLFGRVDEERVIKNVGVVNATVTGYYCVGSLVGISVGTVSNSYSTGSVTGHEDVGGLVGCNHGIVSNSYFTGSVTGYQYVGGLVGANWYEATVSNSYSTGNVTGDERVGGLVGGNHFSTVSNSYSTGNVTGDERVGGLVGSNWLSSVSNSYYNYNEVMINGENIITVGALLDEDFEQWLANDKFLAINGRLSQENGYYVVNNVIDFKELLAFGQNASLKFRLKNDLDLATEPNFYVPYLAGEFDGNGHKISNLSFNFAFVSQVGLFGYLASDGTVYEGAAENVNINACNDVGGLVGHNDRGTVSNSYSTGSVTGGWHVGGLVGIVNGGAGNTGTVSNSYSTGSVTGGWHVGGLVGYGRRGTVSNSYSTGSVTGSSCVGGLVGTSFCRAVSDSYFTGIVTGDYDVGGLVGYNYGATVSNSYSTGNVTGDECVGGLVGLNSNFVAEYMGIVSNSYSTGSVTGDLGVGGLVGRNEATVSNSFWDTETSGQATSDGGTGKTTAEMQDIATFSGATWSVIAVANPGIRNPSYIWNIVDDETYPFLSWEPIL